MDIEISISDKPEDIRERYELAIERIRLMEQEISVAAPYRDYFQRMASFVVLVSSIVDMVEGDRLKLLSLEELKFINMSLYEDITGDNYYVSYADPAYAEAKLGHKFGKLLSFLYAELRGIIVLAYENRLHELTVYLELLIEIYNYLECEDDFTCKDVKRAIYDFMNDYCDMLVGRRVMETVDSSLTFATDIIMKSEITDIRYLYQYGDYISENEIKTASFLNSLPQEEIDNMAATFTEGYRLGFLAAKLDITKKAYVNIRYQIGFERMVRAAIVSFRKLGLEPIIYRAAYNAINRYQHMKIGYHATSPNKQYDYDHRFDIGMFFDNALKRRKLDCHRRKLEALRDKASQYAGPSLIEVFGEELFAPEDKPSAIKLDKRQQKLYVDYYNEVNLINKELLRLNETSFTIISYPVPEIGKDFEAIFRETVKVNTLESDLWRKIQQSIIDTLDKGEYVRVQGLEPNRTDIKIMLIRLTDSDKETKFENCLADVNIPVGEVFTSPVLKGTSGVLHVPRIYLHDLEYRELELVFEDGMIKDYSCSNFEEAMKNKSYIKENLLYNHEALPLGEFAIGTNTTAYMMGKRYNIASRLPILIAEKTGPHFAIGDTCYKMSEDNRVFNPDGKEIIAKDNEVSLLRNTDPGKAYFNCHTDITLPFDEIKEIAVYHLDGSKELIISNGRFVLEGTQYLNKAFDE